MLKTKKSKSILVLSVLIVLLISLCTQLSYSNENPVLESTKKVDKTNALCIMYETAANSGIYEEQASSNWPNGGYIFNSDISGCKNGSEIDYDFTNNSVVVKSDTKDMCYVYFEVLTARHLSYSNSPATTCTDVQCALDELYTIFAE